MVASLSATSQSTVSSITARLKRTTGIACYPAANSDGDTANAAAAVPPASSNIAVRSANGPPTPKAAPRRAIGKPTSCCSPDMVRAFSCFRNGKVASAASSVRPIARQSQPPAPSTVNLQSFQTNCAKPSASTMEPNLPSITGCTEPSMSKLSSAIRTALGKRAASKTPSDVCGDRYPAKPTSIPSPKPNSPKSSGVSTTPRENAWTSKPPPRHSPNLFPLLHFKRESISLLSQGRLAVLLRRRIPAGTPHIARRVAEPLDHDRGEVLGLAGDAGAGAHGIAILVLEVRRRFAFLQRAGGIHHQLAEMHDAEIGRAEMFAGAVGDRALAVLHRGVLFRHALDAGVAVGLLQLAIDQIIVRLVAQRNIILVDLRHHAVAAVIAIALGLRQRTFRIPGIGVDPAAGIGHRNEALAENVLTRHRARRIGMHRHQELGDAPVDVVGASQPPAGDRQAGLVRIDLDYRARVFGDPSHVVGRDPYKRIHKVLLDVEDLVLFLLEGEMREGEMRGVDRAFQRLHPVAVLPFLRNVAMRGRHQRHFQRG